MPLEQIVVDEFDIYKNGDDYAIAFQLNDEPIEDAEFMYTLDENGNLVSGKLTKEQFQKTLRK